MRLIIIGVPVDIARYLSDNPQPSGTVIPICVERDLHRLQGIKGPQPVVFLDSFTSMPYVLQRRIWDMLIVRHCVPTTAIVIQ